MYVRGWERREAAFIHRSSKLRMKNFPRLFEAIGLFAIFKVENGQS